MPLSLRNRGATHAGARELYITIEQLNEGLATSNFPTEGWTQLRKAWAGREFVSLDERTAGSQLIASSVARWEIPYAVDMDPDRVDVPSKRRINYLGRIYPILSAEPLAREQGKGIVLVTQAKVG